MAARNKKGAQRVQEESGLNWMEKKACIWRGSHAEGGDRGQVPEKEHPQRKAIQKKGLRDG